MSAAATAATIGLKIKAIDEASVTLTQVKKALASLAAPADKAAESVKKVGRLQSIKKTLSGLNKPTENIAKAMERVAGAGLRTVGAGLSFVGSAAAKTAKSAAALAPALGGIAAIGSVAGIAKLTEDWAAFGSRVDLTAQRIGLPVEKLGELQTAARLAGSSSEDMVAGLQGLQDVMSAAVFQHDGAKFTLFKSLGIDIGVAGKSAKSLLAVLPAIADETQRQMKGGGPHAAARFLDQVGIGQQLLFVFKDGREGLKRYTDEADRLGNVTKEQADKARELQQSQERLKISFEQQAYVLAAKLGPSLVRFLDQITGFVSGNEKGIGSFFEKIGRGIDIVTKPENLKWLGDEIGRIYENLKKLYELIRAVGNNPWLRHVAGVDAPDAANKPKELSLDQLDNASGADAIPPRPEHRVSWLERALPGLNPNYPAASTLDHLKQTAHTLRPETVPFEIAATAKKYQVPPEFARAIFSIEHGLNPDGSAKISSAGAIGAGQLMPGTASDLDVNPFDTEQNIDGSVRYMKKLLQRYLGNDLVAAAAYNAGPDNAGVKHFAATGDESQLPKETQRYVQMLKDRETQWAQPGAADGPVAAGASQASLRVELHHVNPPPGARMVVTNVDPGIDVVGPKTMATMPTAMPSAGGH